jgi:RNA recognition motif-containing protein
MKKIYVGNLPFRVREHEIENAFSQFGTIENVILIKDRETGRAKGFGFVEFDSESAAQNALTMNGKDFQGRPLKVNLAREKTSGGSEGGRHGGHGGGGRGGFREETERH